MLDKVFLAAIMLWHPGEKARFNPVEYWKSPKLIIAYAAGGRMQVLEECRAMGMKAETLGSFRIIVAEWPRSAEIAYKSKCISSLAKLRGLRYMEPNSVFRVE